MKIVTHYALYDGRYHTQPESATCFSFCETLEEAISERKDYGDDTVIVKHTSRQLTKNGFEIIKSEIIQ